MSIPFTSYIFTSRDSIAEKTTSSSLNFDNLDETRSDRAGSEEAGIRNLAQVQAQLVKTKLDREVKAERNSSDLLRFPSGISSDSSKLSVIRPEPMKHSEGPSVQHSSRRSTSSSFVNSVHSRAPKSSLSTDAFTVAWPDAVESNANNPFDISDSCSNNCILSPPLVMSDTGPGASIQAERNNWSPATTSTRPSSSPTTVMPYAHSISAIESNKLVADLSALSPDTFVSVVQSAIKDDPVKLEKLSKIMNHAKND